ncbi:hypothetical protein CPC_A0294 [Clostridium perfringens C str. JGS1495]|nr:hypothetical protein CPC_A0294 [Clostridium perfringens C str. JGS1495]
MLVRFLWRRLKRVKIHILIRGDIMKKLYVKRLNIETLAPKCKLGFCGQG